MLHERYVILSIKEIAKNILEKNCKNMINIYKDQSLDLQQIPTCTNKIPIP